MWLDGSEGGGAPPSWRAAADECPHRLAALSDGRLEGGVLSCRYHGWEFGGERGLCSRCPQASDARAEAAVLASPRSRLRSLPCRAAQNLVFVWPQEEREGGFENAAGTPLPLVGDCDPERAAVENGGSASGVGGDWGFQRPPVDWLLMAENSMDPNHAPFLVSSFSFERERERRERRKRREREEGKKTRTEENKLDTDNNNTSKNKKRKSFAARDHDGAQHQAECASDGDADLSREAGDARRLRGGAR